MSLQAIRENYSAEFKAKTLKKEQDPPVYKWELVQILLKAHFTTEEGAKTALLTRQFMNGQPKNIKTKLLESEPVIDIQKNVSFVQRYRAIQNYTTKQAQWLCQEYRHGIPKTGWKGGMNNLVAKVSQPGKRASRKSWLRRTVKILPTEPTEV